MMKKIIINLLFCCLALPMAAGQQISGTLKVNNTTRNYIGYLPTNLGENRPMLISCHGMNQDAPYQKNMLAIESVADTAKFLTIFPNGIDKSWDIGGDRDINYVLALIDEMEKKYKIDRNCVYLSGFSMGGMFTYHAMNKIADKIAAFAPISGYPMGGTTANASVRPIPIIHTHGTSDDVVNFGGVQGALNAWIKHNGCPTTAKVVSRYRNAAHITRRTWGPGKEGVEVVLMEMADKGHWISNDNGVKTGDEIWRFCKRYSVVQKNPTAQFKGLPMSQQFVTFGGTTEIPAMTLEAEASDPDGQLVSVAFYDGSTLLTKFDQPPYQYELTGLKKGTHKISVVATDDEGRTGSHEVTVKVVEPATLGFYNVHQTLKDAEGGIPEGWCTYDGSEKRQEFASGFSQGCRVFHLTNSKRDFEWGLYARNVTGAKHAGYARYADKSTKTTLTLNPGNYQLKSLVANWNCSSFSAVTVAIEKADDGTEVYSDTFLPTSNVGNAADKSFSGTTLQLSSFDIYETGRYRITYYTADAEWADMLIGQVSLSYRGAETAVKTITDAAPATVTYYSLSGQRLQRPSRGCYIEQTIAADGTKTARVVSK